MTSSRHGFAVYDLKPHDFPLTLELLDAVSREVVWKVTVPRPWAAIWVPGRDEVNQGRPVAVRVTTPGQAETVEPIG